MLISDIEKKAASLMREDENRLVHQMVHDFSTWEPFGQALRKQLNHVGYFLRTWLRADQAFHFFANPHIQRIDSMIIGENETKFPHDFKVDSMLVENMETIQEIKEDNILILCEKLLGLGKRYLFLPFSQHNIPFGQFVLSFKNHFPSIFMLEKVRGTLNILQYRLKDLLYNHYPITSFTYLPSFQTQQNVETAILFCDIRDSTSMFEIARMTHYDKHTEMLILILKSFLEYASRIISVANIGRIHRYMGDGFVATFGEYLTLDDLKKANVACALGFLIAFLLKDGFDKLWSIAQKRFMNVEFLGVYNEDIDLRLGIGINYGRVRFDLFGITIEEAKYDQLPRGFSEFTAVGDHMSLTQRLCMVANQPLSSVDYVYRSDMLPQSRLTAPIIASRTAIYWSRQCLKGKGNPLEIYRTDFQLKGKGHPMPGFEILVDYLDISKLLNCIENIHNNHFYNAIKNEIDNGSELEKVTGRFTCKLDEISKNFNSTK